MVGPSIAHYRIVRKIGAGGMGQVFLAEDTKLERPVAIKLLLTASPTESQVARFRKEAKAAAALNHPNVVSIYELGVTDALPYVVMEWLEGQTLRQFVQQGPPPLAVALRIIAEIVDGVAAAHARGICHRDLKPENVFITTAGRAKILDFGLAQMRGTGEMFAGNLDGAATVPVTQAGVLIGTTSYMSPEQVRGDPADARSDLFAVGLMLFELLTGERAFSEPTAVETMHAILKQPTPVAKLAGCAPDVVVEVVARCLEKSPTERYATAADLAAALNAVAGLVSGMSPAASIARVPSRAQEASGTIAVLPFANMSGDSEMEYFSDGITEELINAISHLKGLQVAARTSSFAFKGKNASIQEVGAALRVSTLLEGSVRRSGNKLRIVTQLIDVESGYQLWSEKYDRQLDDVFAIQEDIAANIAQKLEITLSASGIGSLARPASTIEAYDLYLKGRYHVEQRGEGLVKGLEFFKRALAVDPRYAPAHAGIAETLAVLAVYGIVPPARALPEAKAAAGRALELDPRLAEAHNAMALVALFHDWNWAEGNAAFDRAIAINPSYVSAHYWKGLLYLQLAIGDWEGAIRESERAVALDPIAMLPAYSLGIVLINSRRYADAIALCDARLKENASQFLLHRNLGAAQICVGAYDAAIATYQTGVELSRRHPWLVAELGAALALVGRLADADALQAELVARGAAGYLSPISLATIPLHLGRVDEAVACFERAFETRDPLLLTTTAWPLFAGARRDARVQQLFGRMGVQWTQ